MGRGWRWLGLLAAFWSGAVFAWDEQAVLEFVMAHNPVVRAQRMVTSAYSPPSGVMARVREYSSVYGRAGLGGTDYLSGDSEPLVIQAGVQISIPLSATKERREKALKAVEELRAIDEIRAKVLSDIAQLRQHEADLGASEQRLSFLEKKSEWLQERVNQGYSDAEELWTLGKQLTDERAGTERLRALLGSQRYQLASRAGEQWGALLAYLEGRALTLAEGER